MAKQYCVVFERQYRYTIGASDWMEYSFLKVSVLKRELKKSAHTLYVLLRYSEVNVFGLNGCFVLLQGVILWLSSMEG